MAAMKTWICPVCERQNEKTTEICNLRIGGCGYEIPKTEVDKMFSEEPCDHEGFVVKGYCEQCGEEGLESDAEIFEKEAPR